MSRQTIEKVYPLTPMQEGMMYHSAVSPESSFYFTQLELRISGDLDRDMLEKSVQHLLNSYDILRTVFVHEKLQRPRQVVLADRQASIHFEDLSHTAPEEQQQRLRAYTKENRSKGFQLAKDLLFRVALFRLADKSYHLVWSNHHILIDGWSLGILMKKLFHAYEKYRSSLEPSDEPERPYADYIKWLEKQDKEEALHYWEKRLDGFEQFTSLPNAKSQTSNEPYRNEQFTIVWDEELVSTIKQAANRYQVTAPNLFQAVWGALLARYNNTGDAVFGTVVSGRPSAIPGIENMAGLFINTIPVRLQMQKHTTFADLFRSMQQNALEAEQYDYVPLYEIQNRSAVQHELINHLLAFENYPIDRELKNGSFEQRLGFTAEVAGTFEQTNYDFNLIAFPGDQWTIKMMYNGSVYDKQWIEKAAGHLTRMMEEAVRNPEALISEANFLTDAEIVELLGTYQDASYPQEKTINDLFEEQVRRVPDRVAAVLDDRRLTYRGLNAAANRLARVLRGKGVGPDVIVALMAERSMEMIVGMLAILKAGGAYLPIDPAYPEDRIRFMLEDSGTRLLLAQNHLTEQVDFTGDTLDLSAAESGGEDAADLEPVNSPDDLSYIIYTSGTTGKPKGVMITHRNVVRLMWNDRMPFAFSEEDAWTMYHSFCFDFSVWEMYGALLYGGKLVVVPQHVAQSPGEFRELLIREKITVLNQTPTAFSSLIQRELTEPDKRIELRYVVFGGEALKPVMLKDWYGKYPGTKLINMYGITETTVHVTFKEIGEEEMERNICNIGVPIPTVGCCIMDKDLNLMPVGVAGELCVAGLGVARGYLFRPELTAERFVDNPHRSGERLYRSGDLARLLPNGEMEYLGRIDHQVKIRGFRIELGEIEHRLLNMQPVTEAAVLARPGHGGDPVLCAYFVADRQLTAAELRETLLIDLPDYMIPAFFVQLPGMPVTSNGKLDRKALPEPEAGMARKQYEPPTSELEQRLADIWQDLLGVARIGIDDDFFALGGHSLKAMMLTTKIHQQLDKQVPIKALFQRPTIRQLAEYLQHAEENTASAIEPAEARPHYPVSASQKRMYILSQLEGEGVSYNIPAALVLEGELDKPRLEAAFAVLIQRHETLRTSFELADGQLVQTIHPHVPFSLEVTVAPEQEAKTLINSFIRPFELGEAPLVRAELIRFSEQRHLLLIDMHHIISDGASTGILVRDLAQLYRGEALIPPKLHYKDFAVWQHKQERLEQSEAFWLDTFAGDLPVLELPSDFARPTVQSFAGERFEFDIDDKLAEPMKRLTMETGTTAYMFLLAAFNVFLSKYSAAEDVIVGSPVAGRTHAEITDVPGMFVNTLALRSAPEGGKTFRQFLSEVKETCLQAFAHQDYPFEELVEKLPLVRDTNRNPLFSVMFNMQNHDVPEMQLGGLHVMPYSALPIPAKFDLTLEALEKGDRIHLSFDFATALYSEDTIRRWSGHFLTIVETALDDPDVHLADIEMLSDSERRQWLAACHDVAIDYPTDRAIDRQFEDQAAKTPDRIAVVDEKEKFTYRELDERSNRMARELRTRGLGREGAVALLLDRSVDTIIAMMAVLKAGGAYVPIDPENPAQRIAFILNDSGARFLITHQEYAAPMLDTYSGEIIDIRDHTWLAANEAERVDPIHEPGDLAYIIYTSGTTGTPKGVMIEHRQVLHLIEGLRDHVYSRYDDTTLYVALVAPFHFDASVQQIFAALLSGHTLFLVPRSTSSEGRALAAYYRSRRIDVTDGTPVHLQLLLTAGTLSGVNLRHMLIGGEALPRQTVSELLHLFTASGIEAPVMTNVYGPTECCVDASAFDIVPETDAFVLEAAGPYVPIGKPLGNNRLYVLDKSGRLQPPGVPGELHIAGGGVGRGYLHLPELTAEKFIADPFDAKDTMYRTGDLARRRLDGTLEFLGRIDNQVKIRGYRIELGEIEAALIKHARVNKAVVLTYADKVAGQELYAYFTADTGLSVAELREWVSSYLPKYMVPSHFVQVEFIPLTSNGKIDRRALPAPDQARPEGMGFVPPSGETERHLCLMWQETLGIEIIGVEDNFFELGGHSLKGILLTGAIQAKWERSIPLKVLFERPTVRELARYLETEAAAASSQTGIAPVQSQADYPVSSAQKRMFILHQLEDQGFSYNMPSAWLLEGELDSDRLAEALGQLVQRHESLRTSFAETDDGTPVQIVHRQVDFEWHSTEGTEDQNEERIRRFVRPFDLLEAPLIRTELVRLSADRHLLLIDMHHIIADGASVDIFIQEIARLYRGEQLPQPELHYKDYAVWQHEPEQQEAIREQQAFWLEQFAGDVPMLQLPTDYPRPPVQSFSGDLIRFNTETDTAQQLRKLASETGTTLHMVMHAAFHVLLGKLSGQEDIVVGSPVSGRRNPDLMNIPGMFVNTLALRSSSNPDETFLQLLQQVKETSLQAMEHQDYPFEELVGRLDLPRDMSRNPLVNVMLTVDRPDKETLQLDAMRIQPYEMKTGVSKFDLTLGAFEWKDKIDLQLEYATDLFKRETVIRWSGYLLEVIREIAANPHIRLADIELLSADEKHTMLVDWNRTQMVVPEDKTIQQLFEEQVKRTPDRPAVTCNDRRWTYRELNRRANRLARLLMERSVGPEQRVGIMVKPSLEMAAGVLAIVKAGAAFVPIDPEYPEQRISFVLTDSAAPILLTQAGLPVPEAYDGEVILLDWVDAVMSDEAGFQDDTNPESIAGPDHLAYMIYTSGTTGQPKGVMIEHHSLVNLCYWHNETFGVTEQDRSAKYAGFGFDASVWEMFPYWMAGADIHMLEDETRKDIVLLNEYFERHNITITFLPTQICEQFMEFDNRSLRFLLTGGDKLKRAAKRGYTLVNNYGPTETTVVATSTEISEAAGTLSIGRPIANTRLYILGPGNQLQPVGVSGELCIAGRGLARGYHNRLEETANKFVADPFVAGARMYRTGDSARWLEDGTVEYLGRIDQQVKVRGYRIELSEIESHLVQHPSVHSAVTAVVHDTFGNAALCAYVVPAGDRLQTAHIQADLARVLPNYMMPQFWMQIEALPLTANGKVDRKALPEPDVTAAAAGYQAPRNETETLLAGIWQEVLGAGRIGIGDNFFLLGGDSIKAIQMASRLNKQGWKLDIKDLFQHPTLAQASPYLRRMEGKPADQGPVEGEVKLTPIQSWFFEQGFTDRHHWNQSILLHAPSGLDPHLVHQTMGKLAEHHDALRMVFTWEQDCVVQYNRGSVHDAFSYEVIDYLGVKDTAAAIAAHANQVQSGIYLTSGPLVKLAQYKTADGDHLLIVIHHLVVDGVSWRILLEDFAAGYAQASSGQPIEFQDKTHSFQDWSAGLAAYANSESFRKQAEFWRQIDTGHLTPLPKDNGIVETKMKDAAVLSIELSEEETRQLLTEVHRPYGTEINDILLTALSLTVQEWTRQPKIGISMEGHGREEIIPGMNIARTVGWFTSQYPIVIEIDRAQDLPAAIKTVKEYLRGIPDKGVGYGIYRYLTADAEQSFTLDPEISFNYLGQFDGEVQTELFAPSRYGMGAQSSPESEMPYLLSFSGIVRSGRLVLSCSFNKRQYLRDTITKLMNRFQHHLLTLIDHCTAKADREFTPSDFSAKGLQMEEVGDILDLLTEKLG